MSKMSEQSPQSAQSATMFNIDAYIKEKAEVKKTEYFEKHDPDYAQRRLEVYLDDIEDLRDTYNDEYQTFVKTLDTAIKNNQETCVIKSKGNRPSDRQSKWGFVTVQAFNNFVLMLTEKGYKYDIRSETRQKTECGGEKICLTDKYITITLK